MKNKQYVKSMFIIAIVMILNQVYAQNNIESPMRVQEKSFSVLEEATVRLNNKPGLAQKSLELYQEELLKKENLLKDMRQMMVKLQRDMQKARLHYADNKDALKEVEDTYKRNIVATKMHIDILVKRIDQINQHIEKQKSLVAIESIYAADDEVKDDDWDKEYQSIVADRFSVAKDLIK